ncbi:hypothetical protein HD806DRAFT_535314 [Xylariaceae sp. AK1471]|nr:hypothetical protein HD806DRAFT_535314 [Xylariaceae sp. AK1471]
MATSSAPSYVKDDSCITVPPGRETGYYFIPIFNKPRADDRKWMWPWINSQGGSIVHIEAQKSYAYAWICVGGKQQFDIVTSILRKPYLTSDNQTVMQLQIDDKNKNNSIDIILSMSHSPWGFMVNVWGFLSRLIKPPTAAPGSAGHIPHAVLPFIAHGTYPAVPPLSIVRGYQTRGSNPSHPGPSGPSVSSTLTQAIKNKPSCVVVLGKYRPRTTTTHQLKQLVRDVSAACKLNPLDIDIVNQCVITQYHWQAAKMKKHLNGRTLDGKRIKASYWKDV